MKKTLTVLLCLLFVGCKEIDDLTKKNEPEEPVEPCPIYANMLLPENRLNINNLPIAGHFEIVINNQLLINTCSESSDFHLIEVKTTGFGSTTKALAINVYEQIFQENTSAEIKIYKTDNSCAADISSEVIKNVVPTVYYYSSYCGESTPSGFAAYIEYQ